MVEQNYNDTMAGSLDQALTYFVLSWDPLKWKKMEDMVLLTDPQLFGNPPEPQSWEGTFRTDGTHTIIYCGC